MNRFFSTMFSSFRAQLTSLWTKAKLLTSLTFWETQGVTILRRFFSRLFDVRPRNKSDYYTVFRWLVSKKLAYAAVILVGAAGVYYIFAMSPVSVLGGKAADPGLRTYRYDSIPLKFYSGKVRILAKDNHLAYEGNVASGAVTGVGRLFRTNGSLLYDGDFKNNRYNGNGKLFYPDGTVRYQGAFSENQFNGKGTGYRSDGVEEYTGNYLNGLRSGAGQLFNSSGSPVFSGNFVADHLQYSDFIGVKTKKAAALYTGATEVYSTQDEYCVAMPEINAVYSAKSGANSLESDWTVSGVHVLAGKFPVPGKTLDTVNELTAYFGKPDYSGSTYAKLTDAVAVNLMAKQNPKSPFPKAELTATPTFDNVFAVESYNKNYALYIYVYKSGGLVYTFYCDRSTSGFSMYSIDAE